MSSFIKNSIYFYSKLSCWIKLSLFYSLFTTGKNFLCLESWPRDIYWGLYVNSILIVFVTCYIKFKLKDPFFIFLQTYNLFKILICFVLLNMSANFRFHLDHWLDKLVNFLFAPIASTEIGRSKNFHSLTIWFNEKNV